MAKILHILFHFPIYLFIETKLTSIYVECLDVSSQLKFKIFLASGDFCRLQINFANSLDPDQDPRSDGPDLG